MSDDISLSEAERSAGIVRCDACPVLCRIRPGRAGACDRYANEDGKLVRVDPLVLLAKPDLAKVAFVEGSSTWAGELGKGEGPGSGVARELFDRTCHCMVRVWSASAAGHLWTERSRHLHHLSGKTAGESGVGCRHHRANIGLEPGFCEKHTTRSERTRKGFSTQS